MRIQAKIALIPILLLAAVCTAAADEKPFRKFVPGTTITLKPRKAKYFLGENILLDYEIRYDGEGALEVDSITGLGSPDCTVVAIDSGGKQAAASTRESRTTGQSGRPLRRGDSESFTIPLSFYCRLEKPGKYRIRAAHNLQWTNPNVAIAKDDPRWAETTIEVVLPDEAQAKKVVEEMLGRLWDVKRYHQSFAWSISDYADFACLRYPVYLPILEKMVSDEYAGQRVQLGIEADSRALQGIVHNPAQEATQVLMRLLKTQDQDRLKEIASALCDRLPEPKGVTRAHRRNPLLSEDADPDLVKPSWRDEFAVPIRQFARKQLADKDPEFVQCAAYMLEAIGVGEDVPNLIAAVNRLVPIVEKTGPARYFGEVAPVRQACMDATYAIDAMTARGADPRADPRTAGEVVHFVSALKLRKDFHPKDWEKRCQDWVKNESPFVREFVLFNIPHPFPDSLLETYRDGIRKVIATTQEETTIHVAVRMAVEFKIPVDELMGALVDRVSEEHKIYCGVFSCLGDLLETGKHEKTYGECVRPLEKNEVIAFKARWKSFLQEHGQEIRKGKHYEWGSKEYMRLMYPECKDEK